MGGWRTGHNGSPGGGKKEGKKKRGKRGGKKKVWERV